MMLDNMNIYDFLSIGVAVLYTQGVQATWMH